MASACGLRRISTTSSLQTTLRLVGCSLRQIHCQSQAQKCCAMLTPSPLARSSYAPSAPKRELNRQLVFQLLSILLTPWQPGEDMLKASLRRFEQNTMRTISVVLTPPYNRHQLHTKPREGVRDVIISWLGSEGVSPIHFT